MVVASPKFSLADIREAMAGKTIKKEEPVPTLPMVPVPTKVSGSGSKKRKMVEIIDLTLQDSEPMEVMKKLSAMTEAVRN